MDPVGQASSACNACRRSVLDFGWALTKDVSAASAKTAGAIWRQASQSMQVESTKKSPGTFSGTRFFTFAMTNLSRAVRVILRPIDVAPPILIRETPMPPLYHVDAFAEKPFAGNPAAVCILPAWRDDRWLQGVAGEMNLSETAFLVRQPEH